MTAKQLAALEATGEFSHELLCTRQAARDVLMELAHTATRTATHFAAVPGEKKDTVVILMEARAAAELAAWMPMAERSMREIVPQNYEYRVMYGREEREDRTAGPRVWWSGSNHEDALKIAQQEGAWGPLWIERRRKASDWERVNRADTPAQ